MAVYPEVVDWLLCCGREYEAPQFVKSGIDSVKKLRDLEEDQFRKIGSSLYISISLRELQDRTSTVEELSQEVSVSVFVNVSKIYCRVESIGAGVPEYCRLCELSDSSVGQVAGFVSVLPCAGLSIVSSLDYTPFATRRNGLITTACFLGAR